MAKRKLRPIRTLVDLKKAFQTGEISDRYWTTCIDSGGCYLRYIGPNKEGMEPDEPVRLDLAKSPYELLAEAMHLAGIQAEMA